MRTRLTKIFTGIALVSMMFLLASPITATAESRRHKIRADRRYATYHTRPTGHRHAPRHVRKHVTPRHVKRHDVKAHRRHHRRPHGIHHRPHRHHRPHHGGLHFGIHVGVPIWHGYYPHGHHLHVHDHRCHVVIEKHVYHHSYAAPVWHVDHYDSFHTAPPTPRIHIVVTPGHGEVYVDGRYIGNADTFRDGQTEVPVTPGRHVVKLRYGGRSYTHPVQVKDGSATLVRASLK